MKTPSLTHCCQHFIIQLKLHSFRQSYTDAHTHTQPTASEHWRHNHTRILFSNSSLTIVYLEFCCLLRPLKTRGTSEHIFVLRFPLSSGWFRAVDYADLRQLSSTRWNSISYCKRCSITHSLDVMQCMCSQCVLTMRQKTRANSSSSWAFCGSTIEKSCSSTSSWTAA